MGLYIRHVVFPCRIAREVPFLVDKFHFRVAPCKLLKIRGCLGFRIPVLSFGPPTAPFTLMLIDAHLKECHEILAV